MAKKQSWHTVSIIPIERVERQIYVIRGVKVMLDADLAALYQVPTKAFNQAVVRRVRTGSVRRKLPRLALTQDGPRASMPRLTAAGTTLIAALDIPSRQENFDDILRAQLVFDLSQQVELPCQLDDVGQPVRAPSGYRPIRTGSPSSRLAGAGSLAGSNRTDTSFETPGSCIVTPYSDCAASIVRLACVMTTNCVCFAIS